VLLRQQHLKVYGFSLFLKKIVHVLWNKNSKKTRKMSHSGGGAGRGLKKLKSHLAVSKKKVQTHGKIAKKMKEDLLDYMLEHDIDEEVYHDMVFKIKMVPARVKPADVIDRVLKGKWGFNVKERRKFVEDCREMKTRIQKEFEPQPQLRISQPKGHKKIAPTNDDDGGDDDGEGDEKDIEARHENVQDDKRDPEDHRDEKHENIDDENAQTNEPDNEVRQEEEKEDDQDEAQDQQESDVQDRQKESHLQDRQARDKGVSACSGPLLPHVIKETQRLLQNPLIRERLTSSSIASSIIVHY
jgi:hypothetical protein